MIQKIHSLQFTLVAVLALACLTGCSGLQSGMQQMGNWAVGARTALPLLPMHAVHRQQSYPVSSQAAIYVHGSDPVLVEALAGELRHYFSSVILLQGTEAQPGDGFALMLHSASEARAAAEQPAITAADSTTPQVTLLQGSQQALQQAPGRYTRELHISITDRHSNITFDRMTIDLFSAYQSDSAAAQKKIQRAFNQAAALLAGQS